MRKSFIRPEFLKAYRRMMRGRWWQWRFWSKKANAAYHSEKMRAAFTRLPRPAKFGIDERTALAREQFQGFLLEKGAPITDTAHQESHDGIHTDPPRYQWWPE